MAYFLPHRHSSCPAQFTEGLVISVSFLHCTVPFSTALAVAEMMSEEQVGTIQWGAYRVTNLKRTSFNGVEFRRGDFPFVQSNNIK